MMNGMINVRTYDAPAIDRKEILRYAGARERDPALDTLLSQCLEELEGELTYKICFAEFPVRREERRLDLGFLKTSSRDLAKNLSGCDRVVLLAATVGIALDRKIARYMSLSPTKALLMQAIGSERIESLCDAFERDLLEEVGRDGGVLRPRFSAGYGDFPLDAQREIFSVLDCYKRIGLALNESLLMSPSKSVTALIGIAPRS